MAENSKIEWCRHTFNPWWGCSKVHEGCTHCYAEAFAKRTGKAQWGDNGTRVKMSAEYWRQPIKWNRQAEGAAEKPRVFCASMADVFEDWDGAVTSHTGRMLGVGPDGALCFEGDRPALLDDLRRNLFALIDATPNLDWLLLTKRPENIRRMWPTEDDGAGGRLAAMIFSKDDKPANGRLVRRRDNVWLGTSVSSQESCDGINSLVECRDLASVLFLSCEPLVGPLDLGLRNWADEPKRRIDLVIVGGESGHGARPMHPDWPRLIRDDCKQAGAAFFFKQWGEWQNGSAPKNNAAVLTNGRYVFPDTVEGRVNLNRELCGDWGKYHPTAMARVGKAIAGRELDGRTWDEMPQPVKGE